MPPGRFRSLPAASWTPRGAQNGVHFATRFRDPKFTIFGRLQKILGERRDIRVVGDRFIFESELLFDSGSANLQEEGKNNMIKIAETLKSITDQIPNDIDWIVQVEGHTDNIPISTYLYPSKDDKKKHF